MASFLTRNSRRVLAIVVVVVLYGFTRPPTLARSEREELASQFRNSGVKVYCLG